MKFEILIDKKENPHKCTIHPLKSREDFSIRYFSKNQKIQAFQADCLLHIDGQCLSNVSNNFQSLGLIDCTWRKVSGVLQRLEKPLPFLVKIPEGFQTAYPRKNQEGKDPSGGLATIEALFIAAAFCKKWDESLLDKYYFKQQFLDINIPQWKLFHLGPYKNEK
ncbi:MAG: hypothetical protein M9962_08980 [Oligoflexia bacterium]|nr:hypothetical protein [Oligoflexia bacterium]